MQRLGRHQGVDGINGGGEEHRVPGLTGGVAERCGEVRLAEAHAAAKDGVGPLGHEAQLEEVSHLRFVELLGPVPFELVESLAHGEPRGLDAPFVRAGLAVEGLRLDQAAQELGVRPAGLGRLGRQLGVVPQQVSYSIVSSWLLVVFWWVHPVLF